MKTINKIYLFLILAICATSSCEKSGLEPPSRKEVYALREIAKVAEKITPSEIEKLEISSSGPGRYKMFVDCRIRKRLDIDERYKFQIFYENKTARGIFMGINARYGFVSIFDDYRNGDLGIRKEFLYATDYKNIYIFLIGE